MKIQEKSATVHPGKGCPTFARVSFFGSRDLGRKNGSARLKSAFGDALHLVGTDQPVAADPKG